MQVSLGQLKASEASIGELSKTVLPIKEAYRLGKFIKKIAGELAEFEAERIKLIQKHGVEDPETKNTKVSDENMEVFIKDFRELTEIDVDLEWDKLNLSGDVLGQEVKLSTQDVLNLEWLCQFE